MKMTRIALAIAATAVVSTPALATNGTNMIGVGAQSRALGGTGTAAFFGAENVIVNPGLIGKSQGTEFSFGGTLFKPSVSNNGSNPANSGTTSSADTNVIPSIALTSRISDSLTFGIGMFGTSGMGVDYGDTSGTSQTTAGLMKAQSNLQIMRFVPTLAFNKANFGVGFSPVIQYGSLDINYKNPSNTQAGYTGTGYGMASDLGMGFNIGGYFDVTKDLTVALSYDSAINMKYKGQLSTASTPFVGSQGGLTKAFGDELEQPAQIKAGVAYKMGNITLTGDYKQVKWSSAKGYKDFNWQDQNVIALGAKYAGSNYWAGIGYNHADNPIKAYTLAGNNTQTDIGHGTINLFNNLFFPATTENHFTIGGGYNLTNHVSLNGAVVIAPETKTSVKHYTSSGIATNTTKHSQTGYTVDVAYKF